MLNTNVGLQGKILFLEMIFCIYIKKIAVGCQKIFGLVYNLPYVYFGTLDRINSNNFFVLLQVNGDGA